MKVNPTWFSCSWLENQKHLPQRYRLQNEPLRIYIAVNLYQTNEAGGHFQLSTNTLWQEFLKVNCGSSNCYSEIPELPSQEAAITEEMHTPVQMILSQKGTFSIAQW